MSWDSWNPLTWDDVNPLKWGQRKPEKYDPDSENAKAARTIGGPRHDYDITGQAAQGAQLNAYDTDRVRGNQTGLADVLNDTVAGRGPSSAGMAANAQRDSNLTQAAALQSGRRGQSAGTGVRMSNNAVVAGNELASQNESVGRANEMAQARGELGSVLNGIRGQDTTIAGQNAQLTQNANQFNASQNQAAALANQAASMGISVQELQARLHQGDMEFTNLDPGSKGYASDFATALGSYAGSSSKVLAHGGVVSPEHGIPRYADGGVIGIGSRRTPITAGDLDMGRELAKSIIGFMGAYQASSNPTPAASPMGSAPASSPRPVAAQPLSLASQFPNAMAHGGTAHGPQTALVGEAGPEAIVDIRGIVDRPTIARLGAEGRPQAVIPLSKGHEGDRNRVLRDIVALCNGGLMTGGRK